MGGGAGKMKEPQYDFLLDQEAAAGPEIAITLQWTDKQGKKHTDRAQSWIRDGKTNKEMAEILLVSKNTILFHRYNIRSKLGLKNKKINLRSHLQAMI